MPPGKNVVITLFELGRSAAVVRTPQLGYGVGSQTLNPCLVFIFSYKYAAKTPYIFYVPANKRKDIPSIRK